MWDMVIDTIKKRRNRICFSNVKFLSLCVIIVGLVILFASNVKIRSTPSPPPNGNDEKNPPTYHIVNFNSVIQGNLPPIDSICEMDLDDTNNEYSLQKRKGYVISLKDKNTERLGKFFSYWKAAYPRLDIIPIFSSVTEIRGLATSFSFIKAVERAIEDDVDLAFFFEDDALPFDNKTFTLDLENMLTSWKEQVNALVLFLGGHHIISLDMPNFASGITRIVQSYGMYSFAIRKRHLKCILNIFQQYMSHARERYSLDVQWWCPKNGIFRETSPFKAHIATPLLVDHDHGFSSTWGSVVKRDFEGIRDWTKISSNSYGVTSYTGYCE